MSTRRIAAYLLSALGLMACGGAAGAQATAAATTPAAPIQSADKSQAAAPPIATMPVTDARVTGAVQLRASSVELSSGASVAAADSAVPIGLQRGGSVLLCQNSAAHLSRGANSGEIMLALDRGAVELHSALGAFSDVLLTSDLRLLISGPAQADLRVRINQDGDTCVQNSGANAPYVTVTEQLGANVYRVQAGQHVMFERGGVTSVIDNEKEPCGCPPAAAPVDVAGKPTFPLAESEGLTTAAPPPTAPAVPPGEVHAQVTIPFAYNGASPAQPIEVAPTPAPAATVSAQSEPSTQKQPATPQPVPPAGGDLVGAIRTFFRKLFGRR